MSKPGPSVGVPVVVSTPTTDSESTHEQVVHSSDYTVILPIVDSLPEENDLNVRRLLRTATALAEDNDGRILVLGVATVDSEAACDTLHTYVRTGEAEDGDESGAISHVTSLQTGIERIVATAREIDPEVTVSGLVRVQQDPAPGILDAARGRGRRALLLVDEHGEGSDCILPRNTIDAVREDANCEVLVENLGPSDRSSALYVPDTGAHAPASLDETETPAIRSILLPVGGGPYAALATEAARAIATQTGARVDVIHVVPPGETDDRADDPDDLLKFADYVLGPDLNVTTEIVSPAEGTVAEVLLDRVREHDVTVIGASEGNSRINSLILDSVGDIVRERDVTVLVARDQDRTARSLYYKWQQGIEGEDESPE